MSNEARNEELTALSLRTVGKDWVEDINYGGSPSAHSSHATLIAELAVERAKVKKLREALEALVLCNEKHNAAMLAIIAKPPSWNDSYLDAARAALAETAE